MRDDLDRLPAGAEGRADFTTTCWSAVLGAGANDSTEAQAALARLCRTYWYPLYAYVRRKGCRVSLRNYWGGGRCAG